MKRIAKLILRLWGWKITATYPKLDKSVCLMAPHTSMWDFIWGKLYFVSFGIKPRFLIKSEVFTWYLSGLLKRLGGIPVYRKLPIGLVEQLLKHFEENEKFILVVTPEATRKKVGRWKTGALRIARNANVPLVLARLDYEKKEMGLIKVYHDIPDSDKFINQIKKDFIGIGGKHPEKFDPYYEQ